MSGKEHTESSTFDQSQQLSEPPEFSPVTVSELLDSCAPHQRALLGVVAVAEVHQMDAAALVKSLAYELSGGARVGLLQLAERMSEGSEFIDACSEVPLVVPPSVLLAFQLARENGTLTALNLKLAERNFENEKDPAFEEGNYVSRYVGLLFKVSIFGVIIIFISIKIVPEFLQMLSEFGVEPPIALRFVTTIFDSLVKFWFVGLLMLIIAIPFCFPAIRQYLRRWNPLIWRQAMVSPAVDRRRSLALIKQAGKSVAAGISMIMGSGQLRKLIGRLNRAKNRIDKGQNEWDSLATEKVISRRDAEALAMTSSQETQAWLLQWSADKQQTRNSTRSVVILRTILTLVNVVLVLLVALTCIAVFATLLSIMASLG